MDDDSMDGDITQIEERRRGQRGDPQLPGTTRVRPPRASKTVDPGGTIRGLDCFEEVDRMVRQGTFLRSIVNYIQIDCCELTELSDGAVLHLLKDYRERVTSDDDLRPTPTSPAAFDVDPTDPLFELAEMQRRFREIGERIDIEVSTERSLNKLFSTTHKEYLTMDKVAKGILDRKNELGILQTERGRRRQRHGSGHPGRIDVPRLAASPETRRKVLSFVEALMGDPDLMETIAKERKAPKKTTKKGKKKVAKKKGKKAKKEAVKKAEKKIKKSTEKDEGVGK